MKLKQRVDLLEVGENEDLQTMLTMTKRINENEKQSEINRENIKLLMEYLEVHLEHSKKVIVPDDEYEDELERCECE